MVQLVTEQPANNRLKYISEVVFNVVLNTTFRIITKSDLASASPDCVNLFYFPHPVADELAIYDSGFLHQAQYSASDVIAPLSYHKDIPCLFPSPEGLEFAVSQDIFSACFYLVSEFENLVAPQYDRLGRYDESKSFIIRNQLHEHPLVHLYAEALWRKLLEKMPRLGRSYPDFSIKYTIDVDHPYKYLHKPASVQVGGWMKDLLQGNWKDLRQRTQAHLSKKDPNHTFEHIFNELPSDDTAFFFLLDGNTKYDSRFGSHQQPIRQLIRQCRDWGAEIGIHPSFNTADNPAKLTAEIKALKQILGENIVISSRQHYLKYRLPDTYQTLIENGVRYDYTTCFASKIGFKHGMARPFPYFDWQNQEKTNLYLHPTHVMDRTLLSYMKCTAETASVFMKEFAERVRKVGGIFTLLFHNELFSNQGEWASWKQIVPAPVTF